MTPSPPVWFAADQVFAAPDGWYVGAPDGYRVGPFSTEDQALQQSRELIAKLQRCRNTTETVGALVRL